MDALSLNSSDHLQAKTRSAMRPTFSRRGTIASMAALAGLLLAAGSLVTPWLTVFAGLQPIVGFDLDGGYLAGVGIASVGLIAVAAVAGGRTFLRPAAALGGLVMSIDALYQHARIAAYVSDPGPAGALTQPTLGSGALLMAAAGGLIMLAVLSAPLRPAALTRSVTMRLIVALGLFTAAWIHVLLAPRHLSESTILGTGYIVAAAVQLSLAVLALVRPRDWVWAGVIAVNAGLIAIYAYAVIIGLPFGNVDHASGLASVTGEPIDLPGIVTKAAEIGSLVIAFVLIGGADGRRETEEVLPAA
ncbi:MAG: hypothetical protein NVS9B8_05070 [Candidatus Limnocylindrales bacterium]